MREHRRRRREMFVPLAHPPGHAQAGFGEARVSLAGWSRRRHFLAFYLPHSDACYVRAYRVATAEAWVDGHQHAFRFFGRCRARCSMTTTGAWCRGFCRWDAPQSAAVRRFFVALPDP